MSIYMPNSGDPRVRSFITKYVVNPTGGLNYDFKVACGVALGLTNAEITKFSIDDLWKKFLISTEGSFLGNDIDNYESETGYTFPEAELKLFYDFAGDRSLVGRVGPTLSITRATAATFYDSAGILQTAVSGAARFDHDPITGESLGLLVEEARTNLMLQSQNVSLTPWTTLITPVINPTSTIAPDGTLTMNSINDNNGAGFEAVVQQITIPDDSANYTFSMYIEKTAVGTAPTMGVNIVLIGGTNPGDLPIPRIFTDTGFIQDLQAGANSRIEDAGDYWRLISTVGNNSTGHTIIEVQIYPATAANGFLPNVAAAVGINRVWGMQMEVGLFATSYIPTVASSVTRNKDEVKTSDVSWVNESAGTFYARATTLLDADLEGVSQPRFLQIDEGTTNNRLYLYYDDQNVISIFTDGGINQATLVDVFGVSGHDNIELKATLAYAASDFRLQINGRTAATDTDGTLPSGFTQFAVGAEAINGNSQFNGYIAEIRYYDVRKNNQFLEDLSNGLIA